MLCDLIAGFSSDSCWFFGRIAVTTAITGSLFFGCRRITMRQKLWGAA